MDIKSRKIDKVKRGLGHGCRYAWKVKMMIRIVLSTANLGIWDMLGR